MRTLERLTIKNFKSIREQTLELNHLNVFIGANGAGKSNLIEVFRFLHEIVNQNLAGYTLQKGGADALLYYGRKRLKVIELFLEFGEGLYSNSYRVTLQGADDDSLFITTETAYYHDKKRYPDKPYEKEVSLHSRESKLKEEKHICARQVMKDLDSYRVYHFHDTSETADVKKECAIDDNRFFRPSGENLAAFLYWLQEKKNSHFTLIQDTIRQIAPFFKEGSR